MCEVGRWGEGIPGAFVANSLLVETEEAGCFQQINPSSFRPHVLAGDRIDLWVTPFGIKYWQTSSEQLTLEATKKSHALLIRSLEPESRKNYGAGLLRFTQF